MVGASNLGSEMAIGYIYIYIYRSTIRWDVSPYFDQLTTVADPLTAGEITSSHKR